jgi:hypothetical protein
MVVPSKNASPQLRLVQSLLTGRLKPLQHKAKATFVAWIPADEGRHCHGLARIHSPDLTLHQPCRPYLRIFSSVVEWRTRQLCGF